jgi:hypothetical protein
MERRLAFLGVVASLLGYAIVQGRRQQPALRLMPRRT